MKKLRLELAPEKEMMHQLNGKIAELSLNAIYIVYQWDIMLRRESGNNGTYIQIERGPNHGFIYAKCSYVFFPSKKVSSSNIHKK